MSSVPSIEAMLYSTPALWGCWVWLWASCGWAWPDWGRARRALAVAVYAAWLAGGWAL